MPHGAGGKGRNRIVEAIDGQAVTSRPRILLHVPLHNTATFGIDRVDIRDVVADAVGIDNDDLIFANATDIVFALENEASAPAVGFNDPFAGLRVPRYTDDALDKRDELATREL